jgi:endonuclease YncB( thermonuclease family)
VCVERTLAICYLDKFDINAMMVRNGHAVAYRRKLKPAFGMPSSLAR